MLRAFFFRVCRILEKSVWEIKSDTVLLDTEFIDKSPVLNLKK
jgi:hypothetical protein